jgi:predicted secreted protein
MSRARLLRDDSGSATVAAHDDVVEIDVAENASSGYRWVLAPASERLAAVEEAAFQAPEEPMPGAGGRRRFVLRLRGPRQGVLELQLIRPWRPSQPISTVAVSVEP